jgi:uncharacterized protein (TIGR02246 family)
MNEDERAVCEVVDHWMSASRAGDTATVLSLMTDDVVFMVPGHEPFGKEAFAQKSAGQMQAHIDGTSDIKELKVLGDWAYLRSYLTVTLTPPDDKPPVKRAGYTLTILRKENGRWLLCRDANLLTVVS